METIRKLNLLFIFTGAVIVKLSLCALGILILNICYGDGVTQDMLEKRNTESLGILLAPIGL